MGRLDWAIGGSVVTVSVIGFGAFVFKATLTRLYSSMEVRPPTEEMNKQCEGNESIVLKYLPELKGKIARLSLGTFPSPIDTLEYMDPESDRQVKVTLKREDRVSSSYGGNKVRTLEFQLACAKVLCEERGGSFVSMGGPGSNQIVAGAVFSHMHDVPFTAFPSAPEEPSLDNTLNVMSMISFPGWPGALWLAGLKTFLSRIYQYAYGSTEVFCMPGGFHPLGVLGQIGGILELTEQINAGELETPKHIFLPFGSSCTTCGIMCGIAIARKLGLGFENIDDITIHTVPIHPVSERFGNVLKATALWKVSIDTLKLIASMGGPDACEEFKMVHKRLVCEKGYAGEYGAHTNISLRAKAVSANGNVSSGIQPWMCSTFTSKSFACAMDFIRNNSLESESERVLIWCTKSIVQPKGPNDNIFDELNSFSKPGKKWLEQGFLSNEADFERLSKRLTRVNE